MLSNSHASATAKKALYSHKTEKGYKQRGTSYYMYFDKVWGGAPNGCFEKKTLLIRDANNIYREISTKMYMLAAISKIRH